MTEKGMDFERTGSTAASISDQELIPVEIRNGSPVSIISSKRYQLETSPEATFHAATPTRFKRPTASWENAELRKRSPRSSAWLRSPRHCSSVNSIRFQYS